MIHKHINIDAELSNVPIEDRRVGRLEHDLLRRQLLHDLRHQIRPPRLDILGDALALDHGPFDAGVEQAFPQVDELARVGSADAGELRGGGLPSGAALDAEFGFGFQALGVDFVEQAEPVVAGEGEEAGREFDDVEAIGHVRTDVCEGVEIYRGHTRALCIWRGIFP